MSPTINAPQSPGWQHILVRTEDRACVEAALREVLIRLGYSVYDPFPGGIGTPPSLKDFVRLFVTPVTSGWVGIVGSYPSAVREGLWAALEACGSVLYAWLDGESSGFAHVSQASLDSDGLHAFLKPGATPESLQRAQLQEVRAPADAASSALPDELTRLARGHNVDPAQAARLVDRLAGSLFGKLDRQSGGEAGEARGRARALLQNKVGPDWSSPAGRRLDAMAALLTLPDGWREPGFEALRDAYHAARLLQRNPRASLLPDEREAQARVPNALDYTPIYFGK